MGREPQALNLALLHVMRFSNLTKFTADRQIDGRCLTDDMAMAVALLTESSKA